MSRRAHRSRALTAGVALLALVATACGNESAPADDTDGSTAAPAESGEGGPEEVELSMWLFGDFGYDPLIERYEAENPHVTITTKIAEYNAHHDALTTSLASGGAPDIAAIEVGFMSAFKARAENFVDLYELGAKDIEGDYLEWKWKQAETGDGSALIGLPTDVGGMAMAYRADLFEEAGLPSDRDEVAALWPTWAEFIAVGQRYTDATGEAFIDEGSQLYNAIVNQGEAKYYANDDSLIHADNPQVKKAWDLTVEAIDAGIVANIEPFAEGWNAAMTNGDFAVLTAPAWMMGYIQGQAPTTSGAWDLAAMPEGGGNWGGSHLAIPASSDHPEEAYAFISWLLAPEQQLAVFEETGNFPSAPVLYDDPAIQDFSNAFFRDAPVGRIYAENARKVTPIYEGPDEGAIRLIFENALDRVEDGNEDGAAAWASALAEIAQDIG